MAALEQGHAGVFPVGAEQRLPLAIDRIGRGFSPTGRAHPGFVVCGDFFRFEGGSFGNGGIESAERVAEGYASFPAIVDPVVDIEGDFGGGEGTEGRALPGLAFGRGVRGG